MATKPFAKILGAELAETTNNEAVVYGGRPLPSRFEIECRFRTYRCYCYEYADHKYCPAPVFDQENRRNRMSEAPEKVGRVHHETHGHVLKIIIDNPAKQNSFSPEDDGGTV